MFSRCAHFVVPAVSSEKVSSKEVGESLHKRGSSRHGQGLRRMYARVSSCGSTCRIAAPDGVGDVAGLAAGEAVDQGLDQFGRADQQRAVKRPPRRLAARTERAARIAKPARAMRALPGGIPTQAAGHHRPYLGAHLHHHEAFDAPAPACPSSWMHARARHRFEFPRLHAERSQQHVWPGSTR